MVDMTYKNFLEQITTQLQEYVNGTAALKIFEKSIIAPYIEVKFDRINYRVCVDCSMNSEYWFIYCNHKDYPELILSLITTCALIVEAELKDQILSKLFYN